MEGGGGSIARASEYDIKFNPLKCQLINFSDNNNNTEFNFDGVALSAESKGTHLGHIIGVNVNNDILQDASYTLTRNVNSVLHTCMHCSYFHGAQSDVGNREG